MNLTKSILDNIQFYEVNLLWNTAKQGSISSETNKQKSAAVTAPESTNSLKEMWTSEHLLIAAVNSCLMSTFLMVAGNSKFEFISFDCNAIGKIEKIEGKSVVTEILLKPTLSIASSQNELKAKRLLNMSEKTCVHTNSFKTIIISEPHITFI